LQLLVTSDKLIMAVLFEQLKSDRWYL